MNKNFHIDTNNKQSITKPESMNIVFHTGGKDVIRLEPDGDIFIHGKLAENDKEIVDGMREFIRSANKSDK